MPGRWRRRKWLWAAALSAAVVAGLGALLHLPVARPFLARLGAGCPVGKVSAEDLDALRRPALRALRGRTPAPGRPALGFVLEATREDAALEWARRRGLSCLAKVRGMRYLRCPNVATHILGTQGVKVDDLSLAFDARGVLVGVDALRSGMTPEAAASLGASVSARLLGELGAPTDSTGEWTAAYLGAGPMRTVVVRYRFRDYLAFVTATQVPGAGVIVHEQYLSATEGG